MVGAKRSKRNNTAAYTNGDNNAGASLAKGNNEYAPRFAKQRKERCLWDLVHESPKSESSHHPHPSALLLTALSCFRNKASGPELRLSFALRRDLA